MACHALWGLTECQLIFTTYVQFHQLPWCIVITWRPWFICLKMETQLEKNTTQHTIHTHAQKEQGIK